MNQNKERCKNLALDLLFDLAGGILYAVGIYTFAKTAEFAPGGVSGLALMVNYLWHLPIGIVTLLINVPFILFSYKILGGKFLFRTARSMIFCTFFVDVVFPLLPPYTGSPFLAALYSGFFLGAALALFYMRGSSSGGIDFLTLSLKKLHPHMSIGTLTLIIDLVILLMGWPVFGNVDSVLYGATATAVTSVVIDKILYHMGSGKLVLIITSKAEPMAREISDSCDRGSTSIQARGMSTDQERHVLLCACSKREAFKVQTAAYNVDSSAFVMVLETNEVFGEGFQRLGKQ